MQFTKREKEEALRILKEDFHLVAGETIYTSLIHVSKSGMYRVIGLYVMRDNVPINITYVASKLLQGYDDRHRGAKVSGCGSDMGWELVYSLGYKLAPDGFECTGRKEHPNRCPSNDHSNGDRDYTPHWHSSGGYAFRQSWL